MGKILVFLLVPSLMAITAAPLRAQSSRIVLDGAGTASGAGVPIPIRLNNGSAKPLQLKQRLGVQKRDGGKWQTLKTVRLILRHDCSTSTAVLSRSCTTVSANSVFETRGQTGWQPGHGDAQCGCKDCVPATAGTYRFVADYCDGSAQLIGASFRIVTAATLPTPPELRGVWSTHWTVDLGPPSLPGKPRPVGVSRMAQWKIGDGSYALVEYPNRGDQGTFALLQRQGRRYRLTISSKTQRLPNGSRYKRLMWVVLSDDGQTLDIEGRSYVREGKAAP